MWHRHSSRAELRDLELRIEAIEARQRVYRMHDPQCVSMEAKLHNSRGMTYMKPRPCDCWLAEG